MKSAGRVVRGGKPPTSWMEREFDDCNRNRKGKLWLVFIFKFWECFRESLPSEKVLKENRFSQPGGRDLLMANWITCLAIFEF